MSDRILDKYLHRKPEERPHDQADIAATTRLESGESDAADDLGCFGWLRGIRDRAVMLELRKADGSIMAIGYGWLERAEFDPTDGITLHVLGRTVRIKGRNLNGEVRPQTRLFEGVARHRVPWIRQNGNAETADRAGDGPEIETIEW